MYEATMVCPAVLTADIDQEDRTDCGMSQDTAGNSKVDKVNIT